MQAAFLNEAVALTGLMVELIFGLAKVILEHASELASDLFESKAAANIACDTLGRARLVA